MNPGKSDIEVGRALVDYDKLMNPHTTPKEKADLSRRINARLDGFSERQTTAYYTGVLERRKAAQ